MKSYIKFIVVLFGLLLVAGGCSHLHVDLDSHWRLSSDARVAVVVEQPPSEVSVAQVTDTVYGLGWQKPSGDNLDAQLLCRWQRVVDLTEDSQQTQTVKSFHARLLNAENGQLLGVADYFYADGEMDMWTGVEKALKQLYQQITVQPATVMASKEALPSEPVKIDMASAEGEKPGEVHSSAPVQQAVAINKTSESLQTSPSDVSDPVAELAPVAPAVEDEKAEARASGVVYQSQAAQPVQQPIRQKQDSAPAQHNDPPSSMETSPWIPRFQGMGLENWGKEDPTEE
nr:hypothetical protein [uncultured Desulfuromonas sp.]